MKKITTLLLTAVVGMSTLLGGCVSTTPTNSTTEDLSLEKVATAGKLIVGLDASFAPMGFTDDAGNIVGFDIELSKAVADKLGIEVEFKPIDWDAKEMELSSNKIDVIWNGFSITPERKKNVLFSNPYLNTKQEILVKAGSDIKTKADLAGKKVALQDGSTSEDALKSDTQTYNSIGDANISRFKENTQVLMEVESGRVDAAVIDEVFIRYYLSKEQMLDKYIVLDENFDGEDYGVGGRLNDKALMDAINRALKECKDEGITATISEKWFGTDITN